MTQVTADTRQMTMSDACNDALDLAMTKDPSVLLLGEDIADPIGGVMRTTKNLSTKYGLDRVRDTPIAEQAIVGAAIGAALGGMRPVGEIMLMDFFAVCMDQVANHAAKLRYMSGGRTHVPITLRTAVGGGRQFAAQHSQSLEAWMMHTPGIKVAVPSTPYDAKGLLTSCIFDDDPCIHMESMVLLFSQKQEVPIAEYSIPLGVADIKRPGSDVSIVTYGRMVPEVLLAAEQLAGRGVDAEVVDLRSLVPLDIDAVLASASKTHRLLVVHAATQFCGPGAEIAATVSRELFGTLEAPVDRLGAKYAPTPFATELETVLYPNPTSIIDAVGRLMDRSR
jgi:pyruvate/2-oxoglutarate/acetoin dehydrogenase E1 component